MTQKLEPLVFFGTEDFSATVLQRLIDAQLQVETVITKPDLVRGRGHKLYPPRVKLIAEKYGIPVKAVRQKSDLLAAIQTTSRQTGILVSFGKIIPPEAIAAFRHGILNLHPSLLPKYRGPTPIENAILNGDQQTGVSIIKLNNKIDAGDIYAQSKLKIDQQTSKTELYNLLAHNGSDLLIKTIRAIENGSLLAKPQKHTQATFTKLLTKQDGLLKPSLYTATELERQIRAYQDFPKSFFQNKNQQTIIVLAASADQEVKSPLSMTCYDGSTLNIQRLIAPSGKTMTASDYHRGLKSKKIN